MSDFHVGDRVICIAPYGAGYPKLTVGKLGRIVRIARGAILPIGVEWDANIGGHHCGVAQCKSGHGLWVKPEHIELYVDPNDDSFKQVSKAEYMKVLSG